MMLTHAGPQSPRGASPFACSGLCRQSYAHAAQVLSIRGLSLASRADSCLEHGQHRLPAAYKTWDGHLPHCRDTFLPLASPCLAGVFLGWLFPFTDALVEVLLGCHRQHVINQFQLDPPASGLVPLPQSLGTTLLQMQLPSLEGALKLCFWVLQHVAGPLPC